MRISDILPLALRNLSRRKVRTILTSLAVFIGIFLLSIMISLGLGVRTWLLNQITGQMEYTRITVTQKGTTSGGSFASLGSGEGKLVGEEELTKELITPDVLQKITQMDHVTQVQAMLMAIPQSVKLENQEKDAVGLTGFGWNVEQSDKYIQGVLAGTMDNWYQNPNNVLVSQNFLKTYDLKAEEVLGKKLTIRFSKEGGSGLNFFQQSQGEEIVIEQTIVAVVDVGEDNLTFDLPVQKTLEVKALQKDETIDSYLSENGYAFAYVNTDDVGNTDNVAKQIRDLGFDALTVDDLISMINTIFIVIQAVLAIFGLIALLVASLGIMNTMIMSIYERTKEIGVMKAIGAKKGDIRVIFLTEAGLIGLLGGVTGVLLGLVGAYGMQVGLNFYLTKIGESTQEFFTFPWQLGVGCVLFAVLIGIISGLYPAARASRLDPIEALRYE